MLTRNETKIYLYICDTTIFNSSFLVVYTLLCTVWTLSIVTDSSFLKVFLFLFFMKYLKSYLKTLVEFFISCFCFCKNFLYTLAYSCISYWISLSLSFDYIVPQDLSCNLPSLLYTSSLLAKRSSCFNLIVKYSLRLLVYHVLFLNLNPTLLYALYSSMTALNHQVLSGNNSPMQLICN